MTSNGFFISLIAFSLVSFFSFPSSAQTQNVNTQNQNSESNSANQSTEETDLFFLCKNGKNSRWLRAYRLESGKCHTTYSKDGYLQIISSATYFASCEGVLHNVRKNIEEGGYKCSRLDKYSVIEIE